MDAAHFGGVVIQKSHDAIFKGRFDRDLFVHFPLHAGAIGVLIPSEQGFVRIVQVTTDPDRAFRDQTLFACFFPADVMQDGVAVDDQGVGDDLLVGGIVFGLGARQEEVVPTREQGAEIFFRLEIEAVETAEFVEETSPDDQNIFVGLAHAVASAARMNTSRRSAVRADLNSGSDRSARRWKDAGIESRRSISNGCSPGRKRRRQSEC